MKIPTRRIPSDECTVYVGRKITDGKISDQGTPYRVHEGEWVEVIPVSSVREYLALRRIMSARDTMQDAMDDLCKQLAIRVVAWNWTDNNGQPLDQPAGNPAVFQALTDDELLWVSTATLGETTDARKNGSGATATSSIPATNTQAKAP